MRTRLINRRLINRKRISAYTAVLAVLAGGLVAIAAPAAAATTSTATAGHDHGHSQRHGQNLWVTVTGDGSHARVSDRHLRPGWVTLHVADHTSPTIGVQLTVVRMRDHYSVQRLLHDIGVQVAGNATPAQAAASTRDIDRIAVAYGGADVVGNQGNFRSNRVNLNHPGRYYLVNSGAKNGPAAVGRLEVRGHWWSSADGDDWSRHHQRVSGTISLGNGTADTITLSGRMPSYGTVRVRNNGDSIHLLQITNVANGVTDAQVQAEYAILMAGGKPTSDPAGLFTPRSVTTGIDAISVGHYSVFSYRLPKGSYLLQCFVADAETGIPHAFMGMHLVVHVH